MFRRQPSFVYTLQSTVWLWHCLTYRLPVKHLIFDIFWGWHPVAVVQYTFTHKQYTEKHSETEYLERDIRNNYTRVSQMKALNIFYLLIYWTQKVHNDFIFLCRLLIHDSYPDVQLFHSLLCGEFPSRWLQLLQWPLAVTTRCAWPSLGGSVTELMPFMNFLVHSYTCCSYRHVSPYWTFFRRWISMSFIPLLIKKRMTECCSSLVHVVSRAAILHYYWAVVLHSCIVLPSVGHSSNHECHCCQLTRQSSCVSNFYHIFIWLSLV
jgi:hypothetical protein